MDPRIYFSPGILAGALVFFSTQQIHAQEEISAVTEPVGILTITVNANADQRIGVPLHPTPAYVGPATSVNGTTVTTSGTIGALSGPHYLLVISGQSTGLWEHVSASTSSSVTLEAAIAGFTDGDRFLIRPYWTLGTLFPNGGGIPVSPNVGNPSASVLLYNPNTVGTNISSSAAYAYHDGSSGFIPAGWFNTSSLQVANSVVLSPEISLTIRNRTGSPAEVTLIGAVAASPFSIDVASRAEVRQDNLLYNPHPVGVALSDLDLVESGAFSVSPNLGSPVDLLFVYPMGAGTLNPSASTGYAYHDGSSGFLPAGWFNISTLASADSVEVPPGGKFIIRKAASTTAITPWISPLPYSL